MNNSDAGAKPFNKKWILSIIGAVLLTGIITFTLAVVPDPENPYISKYPNANAVLTFDSTWIDLEADGRYILNKHYKVILISEKGVKQFSQASFGYYMGYDTIYVKIANVITPDGTVIPVPEDAIKDVPLPAYWKFFMENVREKIITFPNLEVGASIEVLVCEQMRDPPIDNHFEITEKFQSSIPIENKYVEITAPKSMPIRWTVLDGKLESREAVADDRNIYAWSAREIDQIIPERGMPPLPEIWTRLLVSTIPDWQYFSTWYHNLCQPCVEPDETVKGTVATVIQDIEDPEEQMRAIYYYVAQNIRYVETALTGKKAGYKPEPASVTLRNKYGVCRDKAALLVAMYKVMGIPAEMVLISASKKVDEELPADQFDHAIVAVAQRNGKWLYMDPTIDKSTEYLLSIEADKPALVCTSEGEDLQPTPGIPPEKNLFHIVAKSNLNNNGHYHSDLSLSTTGTFDLILRSWLTRIPPARRQMMFQQLAQSVSSNAMLKNFTVTDLTDLYTPVTITLSMDIDDYSMEAGKYLLFKMPMQGNDFDILSDYLLGGAKIQDRKYPLKLITTFEVLFEETVDLPEGWRVKSVPQKVVISSESFVFDAKTIAAGSRVSLQKKMSYAELYIPLEEIPSVQNMLKDRSLVDRSRVFVLKD